MIVRPVFNADIQSTDYLQKAIAKSVKHLTNTLLASWTTQKEKQIICDNYLQVSSRTINRRDELVFSFLAILRNINEIDSNM